MGDKSIGIAMGRQAEVIVGKSKPKSAARALLALDNICKPYMGRDAEFESVDPCNNNKTHPDYIDYRDPNGPLGRLIAVAFCASKRDWVSVFDFGPNDMDDNPAYIEWWEVPCQKFKERYNFY